jgi:hypothetical protein
VFVDQSRVPRAPTTNFCRKPFTQIASVFNVFSKSADLILFLYTFC